MIGTVEIKQHQLTKGYYSTGLGLETILIIGSCRSVPYLNYLNDWNNQNSNRFKIAFIDPFNWNWDINDTRTDYELELSKQESNDKLLDLLRSTNIFIHEYYTNAGMFNCDKKAEKNIYQFGLKPSIDVTLPNFNDVFILTSDIVSFNTDVKKKAIQDYNVIGRLSDRTILDIDKVRDENLQRFYDICSKTDFPEFAEVFKNEYKLRRFFWTFNHTAKAFSRTLFNYMDNKFLKLKIDMDKVSQEDLYSNNFTSLCEYDKGYQWDEPIRLLKEII